MEGAMRGLADGLDPSSAYCRPTKSSAIEASTPLPAGESALVSTRQFYLRVVGVRDGSPAARAGSAHGRFHPRHRRQADARDLGLHRQSAAARRARQQGAADRSCAATPPSRTWWTSCVKRRRAELVTSKRLPGGEGYVRVVSFATGAAAAIRKEIDALRQAGATGAVIDLRGIADGTAGRRHRGGAAFREERHAGDARAGRSRADKTVTSARRDRRRGDDARRAARLERHGQRGRACLPRRSRRTSRADLVGEPTAGIAAVQHLVKLPENRGLWMTYARYLDKDGKPIHEHGLRADGRRRRADVRRSTKRRPRPTTRWPKRSNDCKTKKAA